MNKTPRESNIELLRIILMLMIIMHHFIVHGCGLSNLSLNEYVGISKSRDIIYLFINTICVIGVNCFIFISGYYGIKLKTKTIISFVTQSSFLSVVLYIYFTFIFQTNDFSYKLFIQSFFPLIFTVWWFLSAYLGIYLLSPIINKGIQAIKKDQLFLICVCFLILISTGTFFRNNFYTETGYNTFTLLLVYIFARCCSVIIPSIKHPKKLYILSVCINFIFILFFYAFNKQIKIWQFFSYGNPFIIANATLFFYCFKNMTIKKSYLILGVGQVTFGIYLLHDYTFVQRALKQIVRNLNYSEFSNVIVVFILISFAVFIFIICGVLEKIRAMIFKPVNEFLYQKYSSNINLVKKKLNLL